MRKINWLNLPQWVVITALTALSTLGWVTLLALATFLGNLFIKGRI